jgi:hypothetical protein
MSSNYLYDKIGGRKSLHVALHRASHAALKMQCVKRDISMQEVIQAFSHKLLLEDKRFLSFLDEVALEKTMKIKKDALGKMEIDSIFKIIENDQEDDQG